MPNTLLTVRATARLLGVHENTVRNWERRGLLRAARLPSGFRRFDPVEVERLRAEIFAPAVDRSWSGRVGRAGASCTATTWRKSDVRPATHHPENQLMVAARSRVSPRPT